MTTETWWPRTLDTAERSTLVATFCGWMLDGMDVMVYSFAMPALIALWHLAPSQAGLLATATLLVSSAGGWLAGLAADRFGRVPILQLTILWFAVFTFLSGFTQNFSQLLVVRSLQGLGFGGEWAVGSVLMGEAIRPALRGRAVGSVQAGWAIGWGIAAAAYSLFFSFLPVELAWRSLFFLGILPALLLFYIRRHVPEPAVAIRNTAAIPGSGFLAIFTPALLRTTICASLISAGAQGGYYAITTWLPLYLKNTRHLSVSSTTGYVFVIIGGSFSGYLVAAHLTDRIGRRNTLALFAALSFAAVWCYTAIGVTPSLLLLLGFPLGFFSSGTFSPMGAFFTELFPTAYRGSGQGFSYNFGRGVGALFPTLVGFLTSHWTLGEAIAIFAMSAYALMAASVFLLPETRGRQLA